MTHSWTFISWSSQMEPPCSMAVCPSPRCEGRGKQGWAVAFTQFLRASWRNLGDRYWKWDAAPDCLIGFLAPFQVPCGMNLPLRSPRCKTSCALFYASPAAVLRGTGEVAPILPPAGCGAGQGRAGGCGDQAGGEEASGEYCGLYCHMTAHPTHLVDYDFAILQCGII